MSEKIPVTEIVGKDHEQFAFKLLSCFSKTHHYVSGNIPMIWKNALDKSNGDFSKKEIYQGVIKRTLSNSTIMNHPSLKTKRN